MRQRRSPMTPLLQYRGTVANGMLIPPTQPSMRPRCFFLRPLGAILPLTPFPMPVGDLGPSCTRLAPPAVPRGFLFQKVSSLQPPRAIRTCPFQIDSGLPLPAVYLGGVPRCVLRRTSDSVLGYVLIRSRDPVPLAGSYCTVHSSLFVPKWGLAD